LTTEAETDRLARLDELLCSQRYEELSTELDQLSPEFEGVPGEDAADLELLRVAGEAARRGHGPLSDAVAASLRLTAAGDDRAPAMTAGAVRAAVGAGARVVAERLLAPALSRWPRHPALALARDQLREGPAEGSTREQWAIARAVEAGEGADAFARLRALAGETDHDLEARQWVAVRLAEHLRARGEHREAGELLVQAGEAAPRSDGAPLLRLAGALCLWSGGEVDRAPRELRSLRDGTADPQNARESYAHRIASEVLDTLDRDPDAAATGPRWVELGETWDRLRERLFAHRCPGAAALRMVRAFVGGGDEAGEDRVSPSMAYLRQALFERDVPSLRLVVDEDVVGAALELGLPLILEEERPTETGFLLVVGYEPTARLLALRDPRRLGPHLRNVEDQWRRSALHGRSGLLVVDAGIDEAALAARGLRHDARLELVDRCDLDPSGRVPSQARVAILAQEAIAEASELPALHQRHGQSLLNQLRMGNIEPAPAGPFERWLSETRQRFPDAEWPLQIYAEGLEAQARFEEAGIAWADATTRDPYDERNFLGQAAVLVKQGRLRAADRMLRRALTLRQDHAVAHRRRAEIALQEDRLEAAELFADIAIDLSAEDVETQLTRATVSERRGRLEEATGLLERVVREEPEHVFSRVRLLRRLAHAGDWAAADRLAAEVCSLAPGVARAWETAAWIAWAVGEGARSLSLAMTGLQRCGAEPPLVGAAVRTIATELEQDAARAALGELTDLLAGAPAAVLDAATALCHEGWYPEAVALVERAAELCPNDPNPTWRLVQVLMSTQELREQHVERIEETLRRTIEGSGGYPYPRVILGWRLLGRDPAGTLELLGGADAALAPAPVWYLQARALAALGRVEESEQARRRLPELYPSGVLQSIPLLRLVGLHELCVGLLEPMLAEMPDSLDGKLELARTLGASGNRQAELDLLLEVETSNPERLPDSWLLDAAEHLGAWDVLERGARRVVEGVERDSSDGGDVWGARARLAGAALARTGEPGDLDRVLERAGQHPDVLGAAFRILSKLGLGRAEAVRRRLGAVAPGAARALAERGEDE
jgi:tetratricopeptide (TPR) repeat protein